MPIIFKDNIFHIKGKETSYIIKILDSGHLINVHFGAKINRDSTDYAVRFRNFGSFLANNENDTNLMIETLSQEFPSYGHTDLRSPMVEILSNSNQMLSDFRYFSHKIFNGKKALEGLPSIYADNKNECTTLEVLVEDKVRNLAAVISYTMFEEFDVITRSCKLINNSNEKVVISRVLSSNIDFKDKDFDLIHLSGSWGRERQFIRTPLRFGGQYIDSKRGSSSHAQNPFIAIARHETTENFGEVYGFNLVYSGNFLANVEVDMYSNTRVQMGINPFNFSWDLQPTEVFQSPEVVMVYSNNGLGGMSRKYHDIYRNRLCKGKYRDLERPILINNWEATYFDFNEEKIKNLISKAANAGVDLFVLDDGWFGKRNDDSTSLGDWFVNEEKLPNGLKGLADYANEKGIKFGLWFEPEMVSPKSELYKNHPNWCIHVKDRFRSEARNQLILDLSREDVCDYIIQTVGNIISENNISYVKWDMNRNMTEVGSEITSLYNQQEIAHKYMLGLYRVLETLTSKFPNVLFESCSGGGGRFDPGILQYMPQTWASDNTDPICRLDIQYGTSMAYPPISITSHVSASPNHQTGRLTPINTRGVVAMGGNLGYELDLLNISDEDILEIKEQINFYKKIRKIVQFGDLYRLSELEDRYTSWLNISKDKNEFVFSCVNKNFVPNGPYKRVRLKGIEKNCYYKNDMTDEIYHSDELLNIGINIPYFERENQAITYYFSKV